MSDTRLISVKGQKVGINGLDQALMDLGAAWAGRDDQAVGQELLSRLAPHNYIPASVRQAYATALCREYRRHMGQPVSEEAAAGLAIKVLGAGCNRCEALTAGVMQVLSEMGLAADLEHLRDMQQIARYGVMGTPALVINGQVVCVGSVPSNHQIKAWLTALAPAPGQA
ncbi:MAG: thioredoxin family protein [Pseudomonadota bacterium]